jgi:lipopolysaccharide export system permease protein
MLSVRQLGKTIDSLKNSEAYYLLRSKNELAPYFSFIRYSDTGLTTVNQKSLARITKLGQIIPDSLMEVVVSRAAGQVSAAKANVDLMATDYQSKQKEITSNQIEWHRKFTLAVACIVLFLIGAPLGSIIRKGGLGTPLVFAVIFFVLFHLLNTFGEKFVRGGVLPAYQGMWMSCCILVPIGIFLTYKAMKDSQLFNQEYYYRAFNKLKAIWLNFRLKKNST